MEYLCMVRFGLRDAMDSRIRETTALVDKLLRVDLPAGPYYYRYNEDGYGEHHDGRPFDGSGIGRLWPLLSGERGHYAVASGEDVQPYIDAMLASASVGGMLPEQIWDQADIPERGLIKGRPSGSAMPLNWAHAELVKLIYAQQCGKPIERLDNVYQRYVEQASQPTVRHWRDYLPCHVLPSGNELLIEANEPFVLHYGFDGWQRIQEKNSTPLGLGIYGVRLKPEQLTGNTLQFSRRFDAHGWEGQDWELQINPASCK